MLTPIKKRGFRSVCIHHGSPGPEPSPAGPGSEAARHPAGTLLLPALTPAHFRYALSSGPGSEVWAGPVSSHCLLFLEAQSRPPGPPTRPSRVPDWAGVALSQPPCGHHSPERQRLQRGPAWGPVSRGAPASEWAALHLAVAKAHHARACCSGTGQGYGGDGGAWATPPLQGHSLVLGAEGLERARRGAALPSRFWSDGAHRCRRPPHPTLPRF